MFTEEKAKIGIADFCSKLGGILNLWAGITVVLVLELIELGGRMILFQFRSSQENKGKSTTKVSKSFQLVITFIIQKMKIKRTAY